ncbi:MAG TPA: sulfite exporter TauE/SafE family protein [Gammaproteobacteria bacterium]|nr:sulfite exporter TauE/SafE family protein [Gammaproteobacteria bacterium]
MLPEASAALVVAVLFLGAVAHSSVGFGGALLAMPLLALFIDIPTATPLVALSMLTTVGILLARSWRNVAFGSTWRLLGATALGIPVGLVMLRGAPPALVRVVLGAVLVAYGLYNLARPRLPIVSATPWAYALGFVAGVLGGAYNTNGPPVVLYGALQRWPRDRFRATLQGYFLPATVLTCAGHAAGGLWTFRVWHLYLLSLPLVLIGIYLGTRIHGAIPEERFARFLNAALVAMGGLLLI